MEILSVGKSLKIGNYTLITDKWHIENMFKNSNGKVKHVRGYHCCYFEHISPQLRRKRSALITWISLMKVFNCLDTNWLMAILQTQLIGFGITYFKATYNAVKACYDVDKK